MTQPQPETNAATVQAEGPSEFEILLQKPTQVKALKAPAEMLPPATKIPTYKTKVFDSLAVEYYGTYSNRLYSSYPMYQSRSSLHDLAPESFKQDVASGYVDYKEAVNTILKLTAASLSEAEDFVNELRNSAGGAKRLCPVCLDPRCPCTK